MSDDDAVDIEVEAPPEESATTDSDDAAEAAPDGSASASPETDGEQPRGEDSNPTTEADARTESAATGGSDATTEPTLADRVAEYDTDVAAAVDELEARVEQLEAELETKSDEIQDLTSRLKRKQADFQNYKQRQKKKQERMKERAAEDVIEGMVSVRDNLLRALQQDAEADIRPGVESTLEEFDRVLAEEGVDPIEPEPGEEVDPTRHQVMMRVESDEPAGTVDEMFQPGYEIGDKVIREAQVTVSQNDE